MTISEIVLVDLNRELTDAWGKEFAPYSAVKIQTGSVFELNVDAIVSPANSFGIMDGGLDGKLRDYFGMAIEKAVRHQIQHEFHGELPVGLATVIDTGNDRFPYLVCAPTMRFPANVSSSINAYLAMKAILNVCAAHQKALRIAVPGLCSLSGRMPSPLVARQMRIAYERVVLQMHGYSHWREEREFENYIRGLSPFPPIDLEVKYS